MLIVLAQAATEPDGSKVLTAFLVTWLPIFALALLLFWVLRSSNARAQPLRDRSLKHMERIEEKTDEMIALLKEIRDDRRNGGGT